MLRMIAAMPLLDGCETGAATELSAPKQSPNLKTHAAN
jgi:hypothetical protein